jgi:endonuclease/exonuclease/phosphatase family metal-dependent hydrolase
LTRVAAVALCVAACSSPSSRHFENRAAAVHTETADAAAPPPLAAEIIRGSAAAPAQSHHPDVLRIVDWNIKAARDSSLDAISARVGSFEPDLVVLQEVDMNTRRSGMTDQPAVLSDALGLDYAFAPTIPWQGGKYGIAMLSRVPFMALERIPLSNADAEEPRTALEASLCVDNACVHVIDHHADVPLPAAKQSTQEVLDHLADQLGHGVALFGDLNQVPSDLGPRACVAAGFVDLGELHGAAPTQDGQRIDYAFVDATVAPCVQNLTVYDTSESDHEPLVVDFDLACVRAGAH